MVAGDPRVHVGALGGLFNAPSEPPRQVPGTIKFSTVQNRLSCCVSLHGQLGESVVFYSIIVFDRCIAA